MRIIRHITWLSLLVFVFHAESSGQRRVAHIPGSAGRDTTYMYTYQQQLCGKLGLYEVLRDTCNRHFRFWSDTHIVDVCKSDGSITATLIRWTEEVTPGNEPPTGRVFRRIYAIDSLGSKIDRLIRDSKIKDIPDEHEIEGWHRGLDGTTYMIEYTDESVYYFKSYWTPDAQQHIEEGVAVKKFVDNMMAILEAPESAKEFIEMIPFQCWTNGGISMACKVLTKEQSRKYKRERDDYRKSVKRAR